MFKFFESRLNPFPEIQDGTPPTSLFGFCWYFCKEAAPWIAVTSFLTMLASIGQVALFAFVGLIVDWLGATDRNAIWEERGSALLIMAVFAGLCCRWAFS